MRHRASSSDVNYVGQRIRSLREQENLSQGELLARIQVSGHNMSQPRLSRIEGQLIPVSDRDLVAICRALHVNFNDIVPPNILDN